MLYIKLNDRQELTDFSFSPKADYQPVSLDHPAVRRWLENEKHRAQLDATLERMDLEMARAVEDLIEILIARGVILFTDLPEPVQNKILFKRMLRQQREDSILHAEEDELFL